MTVQEHAQRRWANVADTPAYRDLVRWAQLVVEHLGKDSSRWPDYLNDDWTNEEEHIMSLTQEEAQERWKRLADTSKFKDFVNRTDDEMRERQVRENSMDLDERANHAKFLHDKLRSGR